MAQHECSSCRGTFRADLEASYCPECGTQLSRDDQAQMANEIAAERIREIGGSAYESKNYVEQAYEEVEGLVADEYYSDSQGRMPKQSILGGLRQVGLAVEQRRGAYELSEYPEGKLDGVLKYIPSFGGFRAAVREVAEHEANRSPTFVFDDDTVIDKDQRNWPKDATEVPDSP